MGPSADALLGVQLNNEALVDFSWQITALRPCFVGTLQLLLIDFHPKRKAPLLGKFHCTTYTQLVFGLFPHADYIAGLNLVGRNIDHLPVDQDTAVAYQLPRL